MESLTSNPKLENSLSQKRTNGKRSLQQSRLVQTIK